MKNAKGRISSAYNKASSQLIIGLMIGMIVAALSTATTVASPPRNIEEQVGFTIPRQRISSIRELGALHILEHCIVRSFRQRLVVLGIKDSPLLAESSSDGLSIFYSYSDEVSEMIDELFSDAIDPATILTPAIRDLARAETSTENALSIELYESYTDDELIDVFYKFFRDSQVTIFRDRQSGLEIHTTEGRKGRVYHNFNYEVTRGRIDSPETHYIVQIPGASEQYPMFLAALHIKRFVNFRVKESVKSKFKVTATVSASQQRIDFKITALDAAVKPSLLELNQVRDLIDETLHSIPEIVEYLPSTIQSFDPTRQSFYKASLLQDTYDVYKAQTRRNMLQNLSKLQLVNSRFLVEHIQSTPEEIVELTRQELRKFMNAKPIGVLQYEKKRALSRKEITDPDSLDDALLYGAVFTFKIKRDEVSPEYDKQLRQNLTRLLYTDFEESYVKLIEIQKRRLQLSVLLPAEEFEGTINRSYDAIKKILAMEVITEPTELKLLDAKFFEYK